MVLFTFLVIGQWHRLTGRTLGSQMRRPSAALAKGGVCDDLPAEVCRQIESHGLKLKEAEAAIMDAPPGERAVRPRTHIKAPEDRAEREERDDPQMHFSAD